MSKPDKPKPPLIRFHLSTTIIVVLLSGTLMTLNFTPTKLGATNNGPFGERYLYEVYDCGWPLTAHRIDMSDYLGTTTLWSNGHHFLDYRLDTSLWRSGAAHVFALNFIFCVALCLLIFILTEWLIRRRNARE